ncbi:terminase [Nocardioides sp. SLBN-35]|uniref:terminase n=1 Tax=Nocardioides sp. SLBN-35 TaxID=2768445 RepID=UPI001C92EEDB|nr:terminase [Nocardioides sp. SLBN-35]
MTPTAKDLEFRVTFPTLGDLADAWINRHCRVPDGFARGKPMKLADWQFWICANRYRIREDAKFVDPQLIGELLERIATAQYDADGILVDADGIPLDDISNDDLPLLNQAFYYRRTLTVAPQKTGKGPMSASFVAFEACGPSVFAGWAEDGDVYRCSDNGCDCGWEYEYLPGEPKGMRHPSPLIQITAFSEDQADNIYRPLRGMIRLGPLRKLLAVREGFIRVLGLSEDDDLDRIDVVTSSANSRLGNPISDAEQDEVGLWYVSNKMQSVADNQNRGAAGMGGRTHATTNAWDPAMASYAQQLYESGESDLFVFYRNPDLEPSLRDRDNRPISFLDKASRRKILEWVYAGSWWVNIDSIEGEAVALINNGDPAQAERFFGNRLVPGGGSWLPDGLWASAYAAA